MCIQNEKCLFTYLGLSLFEQVHFRPVSLKKKLDRITSKRITQGWYQQHYAFLQKAQKQMLREFIQTQQSALYP